MIQNWANLLFKFPKYFRGPMGFFVLYTFHGYLLPHQKSARNNLFISCFKNKIKLKISFEKLLDNIY